MSTGTNRINAKTLQDFNRFNRADDTQAYKSEYIGAGGTTDGYNQTLMNYFKDNYKSGAEPSKKPVVNAPGMLDSSQGSIDTTPNQVLQSLQDRQQPYSLDPTVKQKVLGV